MQEKYNGNTEKYHQCVDLILLISVIKSNETHNRKDKESNLFIKMIKKQIP